MMYQINKHETACLTESYLSNNMTGYDDNLLQQSEKVEMTYFILHRIKEHLLHTLYLHIVYKALTRYNFAAVSVLGRNPNK